MIRPKDNEKILSDLKDLIKKKLLKDTKVGNGKPVDSVESVDIAGVILDSENEDRDKIIVIEVHAFVRLHIRFLEDSTSSENIQIRNNKQIEFDYSKEIDSYKIVENDVMFYSVLNY